MREPATGRKRQIHILCEWKTKILIQLKTGADRQNACLEKTRYFPERKCRGITTWEMLFGNCMTVDYTVVDLVE